jgi:hypothetical protein
LKYWDNPFASYFLERWLHFKPHKVADCSVFSPFKSELCGHISTHWVGLIKESLSICHPKHSPFVDMTNSHVNPSEKTNEKYSTFIIAIG